SRFESDGTLIGIRTARGLPGLANAPTIVDRQVDTILLGTTSVAFRVGGFRFVGASLVDQNRIRYETASLGIDQTGVVSTAALRLEARQSADATFVRSNVVLEVDHSVASHPELDVSAARTNA